MPSSLDGVHLTYRQNGNVVSAVDPGIYDVELTLDNKNYFATPVTGTFTITRLSQNITFDVLPEKLFGDAPFSLAAVSSAGLPVSYSSSNSAVASVSGNTVTLKGEGETTITATQEGNIQFSPAAPVTRALVVKLITDIEPGANGLVKIYPNPAADYLLVEGDALKAGTVLQLYNGEGRAVPVNDNHSKGAYRLDVRALSPGIYYLVINNGRSVITERIVKK